MVSARYVLAGLFVASIATLSAPAPVAALGVDPDPARVLTSTDSVQIHRDARSAQEDFERFRETRIPAERRMGGRPCDEPMGRLCLMYPREGEELPSIGATPRPIADARVDLLDELAVAGEALPGDEWILGQRIRYLVEADDLIGARQVLQDCGAREHWCAALAGWVFHEDGDWVRAGEAFLTVLETLPAGEADRWTGEHYLLERDGRAFLDVSDPDERMRRRALLWRLSDPLFMVPGNARWTAHMARLAQVRTLEDAWNPFGLPWDVDLEEILLRYGWALGWERQQGGIGNMQQLQRNRMTARLDPDRRRYLPAGEELERFPVGDDGDLRVQTGRQPVGFTPAYAPDFRNLQSQTARLMRDGELYVVHAFARLPSGEDAPSAGVAGPDLPRDLRTALYLLPVDGPVIEEGLIPVQEGAVLEGVWTTRLDPRVDHILSLEGWSRVEGRAWRTRRALPTLEVPPGRIGLSDPVFFTIDEEFPPESLAEALHAVRPSLRFPVGETMRVGWEVYGLEEGDVASVSIGVERAERSLLRAIGEFFRVIEPAQPVTIRWDDAPDDDTGIVFRAIDLSVPELDEGSYDLFIEVGLPGEEPAVTRRRLVVEER